MKRDEPRTPIPREIKLKADHLAKKNGIPFSEALKVATGAERLGDLLRRLMEEDKGRKLAAQHGIPYAEALEVVQGKKKLEDALAAKARQEQARKLAAEHGISPSAAEKVLAGETTLELALAAKAKREEAKRIGVQYALPPALAEKVVSGESTLEAVLAEKARREEVQRIVREQGLPAPIAGQVASGKFTVDEVKNFRAQKERMRTLSKEHSLPPSIAGQVARNRLTLGKALCITHMKDQLAAHAQRSCLVEAFEAKRRIVLRIHPRRRIEGVVTEVTKFNFKFKEVEDGPEVEYFKHEAKLAYAPEDAAAVEPAVVIDEQVAALNLAPIVHRRDRKLIKNEFLQTLVDDQARLTVTLLEGEKFAGRIEWFGLWEFGFMLDNGHKVTVFRHAIQDLLTDQKARKLHSAS
ncbi:MAG: hypothetical protein HYZ53_17220 [Planctomycetes bacterium]|nr:hypothetical protein [Planctomycetota bacterium]